MLLATDLYAPYSFRVAASDDSKTSLLNNSARDAEDRESLSLSSSSSISVEIFCEASSVFCHLYPTSSVTISLGLPLSWYTATHRAVIAPSISMPNCSFHSQWTPTFASIYPFL